MRRQYPIRLAQRSSRPARHSGPIFRRSVVPHLLMRRMHLRSAGLYGKENECFGLSCY